MKKRAEEESPHGIHVASLALGNLDRDASYGHSGDTFEADLNWEQAWTIGSTTPSIGTSSISIGEGATPSDGSTLLAEMDMMSPRGAGATHSEGKDQITAHQSHHGLGVHRSPPSTQLALCHPPHTGGLLHNASSLEQLSLETGQTLEPVEPLLHAAVRSRNRTVVAMLIQRGAVAVNDRDGDGTTALHIATELGDEAIVSLLLDYGADSSARDSRGKDPLFLAVSAGHTGIVDVMLDRSRLISQN